MDNVISPEAAQPTSRLAFEQSDRNPMVNNPEGDANGGEISVPAASESRVTQAGLAPSPDAGLTNYDTGSVQNEAQPEG